MSEKLPSRGRRQLSGPVQALARRERWSASEVAGFRLEDLKLPEIPGEELPSEGRASRVVAIPPRATARRNGTAAPTASPATSGKHSKLLLGAFALTSGAVLWIALGGPPASQQRARLASTSPAPPIAAEGRDGRSAVPAAPAVSSPADGTSVTPGPAVTAAPEPPEQVAPPAPSVPHAPEPSFHRRAKAATAAAGSVLERPIAPPDD